MVRNVEQPYGGRRVCAPYVGPSAHQIYMLRARERRVRHAASAALFGDGGTPNIDGLEEDTGAALSLRDCARELAGQSRLLLEAIRACGARDAFASGLSIRLEQIRRRIEEGFVLHGSVGDVLSVMATVSTRDWRVHLDEEALEVLEVCSIAVRWANRLREELDRFRGRRRP